MGAALVAFAPSLVRAFKRTPSPALILGYAAFDGVSLGVLSSTVSTYIASRGSVAADLLFLAFGAGGGPGTLFGVVGILLGAAFLAMDFKQVEDAIAYVPRARRRGRHLQQRQLSSQHVRTRVRRLNLRGSRLVHMTTT